ncbi:MAG: PIN domain-containing protein [Chloroflexi bacterium RBG_16_57_9]|nr:MAG: PIN domain-containing protein [Chloroflexi bacterium RBG_16_57_9]
MHRVFVDTVAWIALLNASDELHSDAQRVMKTLHQQKVWLVTTEFVLLEVANALSAPPYRSQTITFINGWRRLAVLHIVPASQELLAQGWTLFSQRADKEWSLTDCTSFWLMTEEGIVRAFTSDHHFEQAGFTRLLK